MTIEQLKTIAVILFAIIILSACNDKRNPDILGENYTESEDDSLASLEKGYDLPIPQSEKDQVMDETKELLSLIKNQYLHFLNENTGEYELPEDVMESVLDTLSGKGYTVMSDGIYSNIRNAENLTQFLLASENGEEGSVTLYKIMSRGSVAGYQYTFDGSGVSAWHHESLVRMMEYIYWGCRNVYCDSPI